MLLANVAFDRVGIKHGATGEFDLMLVRAVEPSRLGLRQSDMQALEATMRQQGKNFVSSTADTVLVYDTATANNSRVDEVVPVEVAVVVECKCSAKQIPPHVITMENGLRFFSTLPPADGSASGESFGAAGPSSGASPKHPSPVFTSGVVQLQNGGPSLLFTPESFRCFRPGDAACEEKDGIEAVEQEEEEKRHRGGCRRMCCLSRLVYMTEAGRLGPINTVEDLVLNKLMHEEAFNTEGCVVNVPVEVAGLIAKRQRDEKIDSTLAAEMIRSLVKHGNLWMLPPVVAPSA
jgi:hypothetical protein